MLQGCRPGPVLRKQWASTTGGRAGGTAQPPEDRAQPLVHRRPQRACQPLLCTGVCLAHKHRTVPLASGRQHGSAAPVSPPAGLWPHERSPTPRKLATRRDLAAALPLTCTPAPGRGPPGGHSQDFSERAGLSITPGPCGASSRSHRISVAALACANTPGKRTPGQGPKKATERPAPGSGPAHICWTPV